MANTLEISVEKVAGELREILAEQVRELEQSGQTPEQARRIVLAAMVGVTWDLATKQNPRE